MRLFFKYLKTNFKLLKRNFLGFLKQQIEFKTFIVLASIVIGIISGFAAVMLKHFVHFFQTEPQKLIKNLGFDFVLPFTPLLGILLSLTVIIYFFKDKVIIGLSNVIFTILRKSSIMPRRDLISHLITSGITVGLGGSVGLEAPIAATGAAIGSNTAKELKLNYQTRTLLLACGSAAGISAIFNSPIAGVIFAFEVLLPEFTITSFIPLLISSASAAVLSKFLYSGQLFYLITVGWKIEAIPFYILLGILCGFFSLYMIKTSHFIDTKFEKFKKPYFKAITGGLILCLLLFLFPPLYGEGYTSIMNLLAGNYDLLIKNNFLLLFVNEHFAPILFVLLIIITKVIATSLTLNSGGNGGIFAPSLFTGAFLGFWVAHLLKTLGIIELNHPNFIVVGMAGVLSGVLHSPLTGIFLIAEVTGGYSLIVPLMIVSALSFFISRYFHPHSIYTTPLALKGIEFRSEREKYFIQKLSISELIEKDFLKISPEIPIGKLVKEILKTNRNIFPVVDKNGKLLGVITLNDIRSLLLNSEVYNLLLAYEIMDKNFHSIDISSDINDVLDIFERDDVWNVAVTENGKYIGFISKSNLFNKYISAWSSEAEEKI